MKPITPDLRLLDSTVAPQVLAAMRAAAAEYERQGIRYALVGGLAVGAQGWPRATKDVDFLVDERAFEQREGGLLLLKVPFQVNGVPIDSLCPQEDETFLAAARDAASVSEGIPVIAIEALIYMKLTAGRMRDRTDVIELIKSGADTEGCGAWLRQHAPTLSDAFEGLVEVARHEAEV